jgi:hypothetical protein
MTARKSPFALAVLLVAAVAAGVRASNWSQGRDADQRSDDRDNGEHHGDDRDRSYAIGLWGDLPYNGTQATVGVPNLIADMNRHDLAFTVHDGDLKSGSSECTDAVYMQALGYFVTEPPRAH